MERKPLFGTAENDTPRTYEICLGPGEPQKVYDITRVVKEEDRILFLKEDGREAAFLFAGALVRQVSEDLPDGVVGSV